MPEHLTAQLQTPLQALVFTQVVPGAPQSQLGPSLSPRHLVKPAAPPVGLPTIHPAAEPETWAPCAAHRPFRPAPSTHPNDVASVFLSFLPLGSCLKPHSLPVHL